MSARIAAPYQEPHQTEAASKELFPIQENAAYHQGDDIEISVEATLIPSNSQKKLVRPKKSHRKTTSTNP